MCEICGIKIVKKYCPISGSYWNKKHVNKNSIIDMYNLNMKLSREKKHLFKDMFTILTTCFFFLVANWLSLQISGEEQLYQVVAIITYSLPVYFFCVIPRLIIKMYNSMKSWDQIQKHVTLPSNITSFNNIKYFGGNNVIKELFEDEKKIMKIEDDSIIFDIVTEMVCMEKAKIEYSKTPHVLPPMPMPAPDDVDEDAYELPPMPMPAPDDVDEDAYELPEKYKKLGTTSAGKFITLSCGDGSYTDEEETDNTNSGYSKEDPGSFDDGAKIDIFHNMISTTTYVYTGNTYIVRINGLCVGPPFIEKKEAKNFMTYLTKYYLVNNKIDKQLIYDDIFILKFRELYQEYLRDKNATFHEFLDFV